MASLEKTIRIVDPKGKVLAELSKILKDVTVEEFKKILVSFNPFRKLTYLLKGGIMYGYIIIHL
jgi:hypothetical protein